MRARGPVYMPKDAIQPLEGVVETDWSSATFTMNWMFTRANVPVTFKAGDPICMVIPELRGLTERFDPRIQSLEENAELRDSFAAWSESRDEFIKKLSLTDMHRSKSDWQKHYFQGRDVTGARAPEHQTKIELREFKRVIHQK